MSAVALVTGAGGFVGPWLVPLLQAAGHRVVGVQKPGLAVPDLGIEWLEVELTDPRETRGAIARVRPACVVHLAALSSPSEAREQPLEALRANYLAVDSLLEALAADAPQARLLYVGTGEIYGLRSRGAHPVDEGVRPAPPGTYSATKAAAEQRARLAAARGLDVVCVRPFNHTGPGRQPGFAEAAFARQIALIERGELDPPLRVGNLESVRDFSDVRDVVRAYLLLLERGECGTVYNVCSGQGHSMREVLDVLLSWSSAHPEVEVDPTLFRASAADACALVGDPGRLRALGWRAAHSFEETLRDVLEDQRARA